MDLPGMPGLRSLNPARALAVQWPKAPASWRPGGGGVGTIWEHRVPTTGPPGRGEHAGTQTGFSRPGSLRARPWGPGTMLL